MKVADEFFIDSHKLLFHPHEVTNWLAGKEIYPIYMEISPSGACNQRCVFCAFDYIGYRPRFLDTDIIKKRLTEMGRLGIKSVMYGGEGEPLLHKDIARIIRHTKDSGIDVAVTTNGTLLSAELIKEIAESVSWIKVSINAGTAGTYAALHGARADDFHRVMENLSVAAGILRRSGSTCTLGAQTILLPENAGEVEVLAEAVRAAGLRYLAVKPFSQHPKSISRRYERLQRLHYGLYAGMGERLRSFNTEVFSVVLRENAIGRVCRPRGYEQCLALPFWSYIDSGGDVWGCSSYIGDERFLYGNIHRNAFHDIWLGRGKRFLKTETPSKLDVSGCRVNCRMEEVNLFLWGLKHPPAHMNFV